MKEDKKASRADPVRRAAEYETRREYRVKHPELAKQQDRKGNLSGLGISVEDYDRLLEFQGGVCAICGKPESAILFGKVKRLSVDHCHESKLVRGLLCGKCNTAIGLLNHDIELLTKAEYYLLSPVEFPISPPARSRTRCLGP